MALTTVSRRDQHLNETNQRPVPPAAVWDLGQQGSRPTNPQTVRTLQPISVEPGGGNQAHVSHSTAREHRTDRKETGRTYLLGVLLGFTVVLGTVVAIDVGEDAAAPSSPTTVTAGFVK